MHQKPARALARSFNEFGFDLLRRLSPGANAFISPLSIATALGSIIPGARGDTLRDLCALICPEGREDGFPEAMKQLLEALREQRVKDTRFDDATGELVSLERTAFELHIANALFPQEGYPLREEYLSLVQRAFDSAVTPVNFEERAEEAADIINAWAEEKTEGMIRDLVPPDLDPTTRLVLVNAVYFKAAWASPFGEYSTAPRDFHISSTESVSVPSMRQTMTLGYVEDRVRGFAAIELPYEAMAMTVVLPDQGRLGEVEAAFTANVLQEMLGAMAHTLVSVELPRLELAARVQLEKQLPDMGAPSPFDLAKADFSGVTEDPMGLFISQFIHQARIIVDEDGTEAAAATAITALAAGMPEKLPEPIPFHVNRPYLFLIRDPGSGTVLFVGRVMNPS